jgi:hypothetical protein
MYPAAIAFSERLGGRRVDERPIVLGGERHLEFAYRWDDLGAVGSGRQ